MQKNRAFILMACLVLLTVFLSGTVTTAMPPNQSRDVAFKIPEEAVTTYLEGVIQGDLGKILQACAINEMSEHFNFDLYIEMLQALTFQAPSPSNSPFYVEQNKAQFSAQISTQVKFFVYGLLFNEEVSPGKVVMMDAEKAAKFAKDVNPSRLASIEVLKIGLPNKKVTTSARYMEDMNKAARVYGADESTERVALFSFEQNYYFVGFTLFRYGEIWKISSQSSAISGANVIGTPQRTTVAEFESMLNGD